MAAFALRLDFPTYSFNIWHSIYQMYYFIIIFENVWAFIQYFISIKLNSYYLYHGEDFQFQSFSFD